MSYGALAIHGMNYWLSDHEFLTHGSWTFGLYILLQWMYLKTSDSTKWLSNIFQKAYRCNYDCWFFVHTCKCRRNTSTKLKLFHYWSEHAMMAMMIHIAMVARHRYIGHTIQIKNVRGVEIVGQIHNLKCFSKMYFLKQERHNDVL